MEKIADSDVLVKLQMLEKRVAECVALLETASERIEEETALASERIETSDADFNQRMQKIEAAISELQEFMTQTGAARLRISAEHALQDGKQHLAEIRQAMSEFKRLAAESCDRLDQVAKLAAGHITESVQSLKLNDFKKFTSEQTKEIRQTSKVAIQRVHRVIQWFRWERFGMAVVVAVIVALLTGLFVNDEAPWESHKKVVAEREAGKMLLGAWSGLSSSEKTHIEAGASYL